MSRFLPPAFFLLMGFSGLLPGIPLACPAADWPVFLGPAANATSTETGLVDAIPEQGLPIVWDRDIGTGYSAPSVVGGQVFLFHRAGNQEILECMEATSGKTLWKGAHPSRFVDPYGYNNGPRCAPLVADTRIYTFGAEGRLTAWDRTSGTVVWQRDIAADFQVPEAFFGVGSTPVLAGDQLMVMVGGQPNSGVVSFEASTGKTLWEQVGERTWEGQPMLDWPGERTVSWKRWDKSASYASLITADLHGQPHLLALMRQGLVVLRLPSGTPVLHRWFRARVEESVNAMTPLVHGNRILLSSAYARSGSVLIEVEPEGKSPGFREVWKNLSLEMHWSQPILVDGFLYGFSGRNEPDAVFRCVEFGSGDIRWERDERWGRRSTLQPPVFGRGSLLGADGKLWALGEGGLLGLFEPSPEACREKGRWQVPSLKYPCWAGPVLADGHLFLRSEDHLVCVRVRP